VSLAEIDLDYGPHQVGFIHYITNDSTRTYYRSGDWTTESIFRPIPISIWYPANLDISAKKPISVLDYMEILKQEEEWENLPSDQILNWFYYQNTPENQSHLLERSRAYLNEKVIDQKFPVVVYAPSYQASSIENFALCEYLASHGYFVIASPSRGADSRLLEGGTPKDMEAQARDLEFLIKESYKYSNANTTKLATMGFSFGGLSQVLTQMRNDNVGATVSLDGSIKYQYETLKKSPFVDVNKVDVPFIHFSQKEIPEQVLKENKIDPILNTAFDFYDDLKYSDAYHHIFHDLTHSYFSTLGVLFENRDSRQDKSDAEIMLSYRWLSIYIKHFLDTYLKSGTLGREFLKIAPDQQIGIKGIVTMESKSALERAFTFQDFNELAASKNYVDLPQLYDSLKIAQPQFSIREGNLNNLGLHLVFNPETSKTGIEVFQLALSIFPQSANLWDSQAEAYLFMNDYSNAKSSFEQSLQLYPENQNATKRLLELKNYKD
jgi:dienelactone hydrolase